MRASRLRHLVLIMIFAGVLSVIGAGGGAAAAAPVPDDDPGSPAQLSHLGMAYQLFEAVFNGSDAEAAVALVDDDAVIRTPFGEYTGPQGLLDYIAFVKRSYLDATFDVASVSLVGNTVVIDWHMRATKLQIDPTEHWDEVSVDMPGSTTISVGSDAQVAALTQENGEMSITYPQDEVVIATGGIDCVGPCIP